ncbi:type II toxin-antitoxin system PemK/MazF family toxin [Arthrobacter deserti]|uniref:Type II toxin-antitoxin system PemK/MazF family toxin n=1 Tax=Arthrobacter deserti TaxID=1742687 RepID=A0ABX1JJ37_9MICC|nr:type II toxin-antitoxin system PemK/MazF family toxin [Arthrobacter deserti]
MAFDRKTLGRILRGAAEIIRAASAAPGGRGAGPAAGKAPVRRTRAGTAVPKAGGGARTTARPGGTPVRTSGAPRAQLSSPYAGDFHGRAAVSYAPDPDGDPDPGEVVWTWVPFEEDYSQGKDRPVLLVGRSGQRLLALMLTSRDRNNGSGRDADYLDVGSGPWDSKGRPSEVKLDRILQIDPRDIRREGADMGRAASERVAAALRELHGWS